VRSAVRGAGYLGLKRGLDAVSSGLGLIVLSPVIAMVAVFVSAKLGRPVIFAQDRPGLNGEVFRLYKFRTMKTPDASNGFITDEQRLTRFGRALRSTSLDELPTLVNVFRGEMSIVGPRPLLVQYLERYSPEQARRHDVRPGITGLAQVSGRNSISWEKKFTLDIEYAERVNLGLDLRILVRTLSAVLRRNGISADGHVTAEEFLGTPRSGDSDR
jgi:lipopolysaccharide/colanic/teichoic acid biosynthesis glycosyltransferase